MPAFEMAKEAKAHVDNGDKPLNELLTRSMVDLYVGSESKHWILHEKLLVTRSGFFKSIFQKKGASSPTMSKSFGLPDEDDAAFQAFVGWLYSGQVFPVREESDLTTLFELYLMGEKWAVPLLERDVMDAVRSWYHDSDSYPGLRRVQYIYAETAPDSPMRSLLVNSIARMLALGDGIPQHWDKALRKNGQLAVDLIMCVQSWKLDPNRVPDLRDENLEKMGYDMSNLGVDGGKVESEMKRVMEKNGGEEKMTNGWHEPKFEGTNGIKQEEEED